MCEAKPGVRCQTEARRALANASAHLKTMDPELNTGNDFHDAIDRVSHAQWDLANTKAGREETAQLARDGNEASQATLRAAETLAYARAEQVELMPPANPDWSLEQRRAHRKIANLREQLAYASTHIDHDGSIARDKWGPARHRMERDIRALSAEWGIPHSTYGTPTQPPAHCDTCGDFHHPDQTCDGLFEQQMDYWLRSTDPRDKWSYAAYQSTDDRWRTIMDDEARDHPASREDARLAGDHMLAHGHMQCGQCGQWRSIRSDNHTCPTNPDDHLPVHPDYVYPGTPPHRGTIVRAERLPTVTPVHAGGPGATHFVAGDTKLGGPVKATCGRTVDLSRTGATSYDSRAALDMADVYSKFGQTHQTNICKGCATKYTDALPADVPRLPKDRFGDGDQRISFGRGKDALNHFSWRCTCGVTGDASEDAEADAEAHLHEAHHHSR